MEPASAEGALRAENWLSAQTLLGLIHRLRPMDRQIMLLYLEGESAAGIAQVTGLSPANIATKIHRLKALLRQQYVEGGSDE